MTEERKRINWTAISIIIAALIIAGSIIGYLEYNKQQAKEVLRQFSENYTKDEICVINEKAAKSALLTIASAQELYNARYGTYTSMARLFDKEYIDRDLASGCKGGYLFQVLFREKDWCATAYPAKQGETGVHGYYINIDGEVRQLPPNTKVDISDYQTGK